MFTERANVDVRNVKFGGLGRTTNAKFDDTTFDANGNPIHIGSNESGRFPVTLRHLIGPTTPQANGYQFTFAGNVVTCPLTPMVFRWGLALKGSHYGLIQDNVIVNWAGEGLVTEDGSETGNMIVHNFVGRTNGSGKRDDNGNLGSSGGSFWFRGPGNYVVDNVATTAQGYGFDVYANYLGTKTVPVSQGQDPAVAGEGRTQDMNAVALQAFSGNEAYGMPSGLTIWWIGTNWQTPRLDTPESVVKDTTLWNFSTYGYFAYQTYHLTVDGFVARGTFGNGALGLYYGDYWTQEGLVTNADIRGLKIGIAPTTKALGENVFKDSFLDNRTNIRLQTIWTSGYRADGLWYRDMDFQNIRFGTQAPTIGGVAPKDVDMQFLPLKSGGTKNYVQEDEIHFYDYNGVSGDDFQAYYLEQAPSFVVPQTTINSDGTERNVGSPAFGLTNQQNWTTYGVAIAGTISPCSDQTSHPRVRGFTCGGAPPN
jgi:hypothetical protein